jgi:Tfp pilus assembly protein PilV
MPPSKAKQIAEAAQRARDAQQQGRGDAGRQEIAERFRARRQADVADADDIQQVWTASGWKLKQQEKE